MRSLLTFNGTTEAPDWLHRFKRAVREQILGRMHHEATANTMNGVVDRHSEAQAAWQITNNSSPQDHKGFRGAGKQSAAHSAAPAAATMGAHANTATRYRPSLEVWEPSLGWALFHSHCAETRGTATTAVGSARPMARPAAPRVIGARAIRSAVQPAMTNDHESASEFICVADIARTETPLRLLAWSRNIIVQRAPSGPNQGRTSGRRGHKGRRRY